MGEVQEEIGKCIKEIGSVQAVTRLLLSYLSNLEILVAYCVEIVMVRSVTVQQVGQCTKETGSVQAAILLLLNYPSSREMQAT